MMAGQIQLKFGMEGARVSTAKIVNFHFGIIKVQMHDKIVIKHNYLL